MKKIICVILCACVFFASVSFSSSAEDSSEKNWYCLRTGKNQPPITKDELTINKYGGFSIDRSVNDGSEKRILYLTFDAGYENGNIESILNTLRDKSVSAAFFILDNLIIKNTELVLRMADEGHLICNHSKNHKNLCKMTFSEIEADLSALERIYMERTGKEMSNCFRFPEGKYNERTLECISNLGYKSVFWSFAYADWDNNNQPSDAYAIKKILDNTHNGSIILLHPTSATNARILPVLIDEWRKMGYSFGNIDEI